MGKARRTSSRARAKGGSVADVIERTLAHAPAFIPSATASRAASCLTAPATADPEARALTAAAKQASRAAIRDFIATRYPDRADELADFVTIAMAGMSAAARDGADEATLKAFAEAASRAFCRELKRA